MKRKIPKRVLRIVERCQAGEKLCKSLHLKEGGDTEVLWHFEPSGRHAPPKSAEKATASGLLRPAGDALFDPSLSQTWIAA